jgi:hypothetical protein
MQSCPPQPARVAFDNKDADGLIRLDDPPSAMVTVAYVLPTAKHADLRTTAIC